MPGEFSEYELSIIGNMILSKSNKTIADLLDRPVKEVVDLVTEIKIRENLISFQDKLDTKIAQRKALHGKHQNRRGSAAMNKLNNKAPETEIQKELRHKQEQRQIEKIKRLNEDEKRRSNKEKNNRPKFKMKNIDYSQLHSLRIDSKTIIYIKPGEDPAIARANFLNIYKKSFGGVEAVTVKIKGDKYCPGCKVDKGVKEFYRDKASTDGRNKYCAQCCRDETSNRTNSKKILI